MNDAARKWIERAEKVGTRLAGVVDHVVANDLKMDVAEWVAICDLFATIARFHLDAEKRVVTTPDHSPDAGEKVAEQTPALRRFGKWVDRYCQEVGGTAFLRTPNDGNMRSWIVWYDTGNGPSRRRQGQVPEVDPQDPRPILDRARAAAEAAAVAAFGPCEFGCES